jgi:hypothetical protein
MDVNGVETLYPSFTAAAKAIGVSPPTIAMACTGGYKCHGLYFRKAEIVNEQLTPTQASVIIAYARNGMRVKPTSEELFLCWNGVDYHLDKARQKTGKDPRNFFDLYELVEISRKVLEDEN